MLLLVSISVDWTMPTKYPEKKYLTTSTAVIASLCDVKYGETHAHYNAGSPPSARSTGAGYYRSFPAHKKEGTHSS